LKVPKNAEKDKTKKLFAQILRRRLSSIKPIKPIKKSCLTPNEAFSRGYFLLGIEFFLSSFGE